ncbi:MAG: hypothetical protein EU548_01295 [Promethearchaeota archaeon]|nr:MAG: hypothetical protein EU548_01295 [Candidatus Lokiarchaeota archaeon]
MSLLIRNSFNCILNDLKAASGVQELFGIQKVNMEGHRFNVEYVRNILNSEVGNFLYEIHQLQITKKMQLSPQLNPSE